MQPLVAPRRMKEVRPERDLLYKDTKDVSERTVDMLRALSPDRQGSSRARRLAQSTRSDHAWEIRTSEPEHCRPPHYPLPHPGGQRHASPSPRVLWD